MLGRFVAGRRGDPKHAGVPLGQGGINGDSHATHTRVDREPRAANRPQKFDFGV